MISETPAASAIAGTTFPLWGGLAVVQTADGERLAAAVGAVKEVLERFDAACSRFRPDSELARVNAGGGRPVAVSPLLLEATGAALRAARLTDGAVDPTVGGSLIALGYDRDLAEVRAGASPGSWRIVPAPGWRTVEIDEENSTIRVPATVTLDLGATAKALAADHAAAQAARTAGCGVLVGLAGDIALAGDPPQEGWVVRVTDDHRAPAAPGQTITLHAGGLATSSTRTRRWGAAGDERHHLVDPLSGAPAREVWRAVSVCAASCLDANTASTAAIVRPDGAERWLTAGGLPSRLVTSDGHVSHLAGWPTSGEELVAA